MRRSKKNSSKNLFFMVAAVVTVSVAAIYFVFNGDIRSVPNVAKKQVGDVVVAEINGNPIYSSEAERQFSNMIQGAKGASFSQLDEQAKFVVIRELAAQKMILEDAYKQGVAKKSNVQDRINSFKENVIKEEFLAQMAKNQVTEEKIKQRYESDKAELEGKSQFKIKHILVKTESDAKEAKRLLKVKSFANVAKDKSIDDKTALTGGDLGYLVEGNMIPEIEQALEGVKVGGVSDPVKTQFGWHILKLESKQDAEPAPYDQVKGLLARALYQEAIQNYVKSAVEKANIELIASANTKPYSKPQPKAEAKPAADSEAGDASAEDVAPDAEMGGEEAESNS